MSVLCLRRLLRPYSQRAFPQRRRAGTASGAVHISLAHVGQACSTDRPHRHLELGLEDFERAIDALLPEGRETPDVRTSDANPVGAQRQRLEDI